MTMFFVVMIRMRQHVIVLSRTISVMKESNSVFFYGRYLQHSFKNRKFKSLSISMLKKNETWNRLAYNTISYSHGRVILLHTYRNFEFVTQV